MKCLICTKMIEASKHSEYHDKCFRELLGTIKVEPVFPFSRREFFVEIPKEATKRIGISGVQPKLGVRPIKDKVQAVGVGFTHIIKPSPETLPQAAENEFLSMKISELVGLKTAQCGLMRFSDGELVYITKRFDLQSRALKIHQEDMMQAMGIHPELTSNPKYDAKTYEDVGLFFKEQSSVVLVADFFQRVFFNFMIGNNDYHLKNITIQFIRNRPGGISLSPHYDALNTGVFGLQDSEMACLIFSDGDGFSEKHAVFGYHTKYCFDEFAKRIGLTQKASERIYEGYLSKFEEIRTMVRESFLSEENKIKYEKILVDRKEKFERK